MARRVVGTGKAIGKGKKKAKVTIGTNIITINRPHKFGLYHATPSSKIRLERLMAKKRK